MRIERHRQTHSGPSSLRSGGNSRGLRRSLHAVPALQRGPPALPWSKGLRVGKKLGFCEEAGEERQAWYQICRDTAQSKADPLVDVYEDTPISRFKHYARRVLWTRVIIAQNGFQR